MSSLSIIVPANGADSVEPLLQSLLAQMKPQDEVIVVGDGPRPAIRNALSGLDPRVRYLEFGPSHCWGYPQRNAALGLCGGRYVLTLEESDQVLPGALEAIRMASEEAPDRPLMFRIRRSEGPVWISKTIAEANVVPQMFVTPNAEGRLGRWGRRREGGLDFVQSTLQKYPEGDQAVVWRRELLAVVGT